MDKIHNDKKELRKKLLEKLLSLTVDQIKKRSENVKDLLSNLPIYKNAKIVMVFFPLKGEVDLLGMIRKDLGKKRFCFPVMDTITKDLRVFEVHDLDRDFIPGPYGVMEPDTKRLKEVDIKDINMVIVPGLAFDHKKNRLGRGAGFYDRFLKNIKPPVKKVGVAFQFQILIDLPIRSSYDQTVDLVVSEDSVI